jgi:hypothetical protein
MTCSTGVSIPLPSLPSAVPFCQPIFSISLWPKFSALGLLALERGVLEEAPGRRGGDTVEHSISVIGGAVGLVEDWSSVLARTHTLRLQVEDTGDLVQALAVVLVHGRERAGGFRDVLEEDAQLLVDLDGFFSRSVLQ